MKKVLPLWLIFIFVLVFFLRLPSLFDPYSYGDEGIYLTLGEAVRKGLILYRDIHDNKPPLLYLLAAISGSLFWFRFLLLTSNLVAIYIFYRLGDIIFAKNKKVVKVSTLIFAFLSSLPLIEGNIANAEIFMTLPTIAAVFIFLSQVPSFKSYFLIGLLLSIATLFKIPAGFDFAALGTFIIFFQSRKNISSLLLPLFSLTIGFLFPILITFAYFWSHQAFNQYLTAAFAQNIPYLSSWQGGTKVGFTSLNLLVRAGLVFLLIAFLWLRQKTINNWLLLISIWFAFSLFAALLSARPYPHYLIQVLPSFSLLLAAFFNQLKFQEKTVASLLLGSLIFALVYFRFWAYPVFSYYQNFLAFVLGQKTQEEYFRGFGGKVPQTYKLAQFLITHTQAEEKVFIWGDSPVVYALARRLPVGRYTASYHIIDFNGYQETIEAIKKEQPRFIIDLNDEQHPFPQLKTFLDQKYLFLEKVDRSQIFRLSSPAKNDIIKGK